jgi:AcrR family transcriptional regulator
LPKGFTESEKALIRQRLLSEGYKQFSAYGLNKTTIKGLAQAAKISIGAFYLFYESKEALFLDVAEVAEQRFRHEILSMIDRPGPSPRSRLFAVFKTAFALLKTIPILQFFTSSDYDMLFRRMPPEKLEEHLASDRLFFEKLFAHCRNAGIPIRAQPDEIISLLYPLVLAVMHEDDLGQTGFGHSIDWLLELVAAFCLGEVEIQLQEPFSAISDPEGKNCDESSH